MEIIKISSQPSAPINIDNKIGELGQLKGRKAKHLKANVAGEISGLISKVVDNLKHPEAIKGTHDQALRLIVELRRLEKLSPVFAEPLKLLENEFEKTFHAVAPTFTTQDLKTRDVASLKQMFGSGRLETLSRRYADIGQHVDLSKRTLTDKQFELILVAAADVRSSDIDDLWSRIKSDHPPRKIFHLNEEQTKSLIESFAHINSLDQLSKLQMNQLIEVLCPFNRPEDIFLGKPPSVTHKCTDSGKTIKGIRERVYLQQQMRFTSLGLESLSMNVNDPDRSKTEDLERLKWATTLSKRLNDREPPAGAIIAHPQGFYQLHANIHGGGAYKLLLKTYSRQEDNFINTVACRGTRAQRQATGGKETLLDDIRQDMGSKGSLMTEKLTDAYLSDPSQGFVRTPEDKVHYIGFSLGGADAMRDACLHLDHIAEVTTLCGAGVDNGTLDWFRDASNRLPEPINVTHIIDLDDRVHAAGDGRIGRGCDPDKVRLRCIAIEPSEQTQHLSEPWDFDQHRGSKRFVKALLDFVVALGGPHVRNTFERDYRLYIMDSRDPAQRDNIQRALDNNAVDPVGYRTFELRRKKLAKKLEDWGILDKQRDWDFADRLKMPTKESRHNVTDGVISIHRLPGASVERSLS